MCAIIGRGCNMVGHQSSFYAIEDLLRRETTRVSPT